MRWPLTEVPLYFLDSGCTLALPRPLPLLRSFCFSGIRIFVGALNHKKNFPHENLIHDIFSPQKFLCLWYSVLLTSKGLFKLDVFFHHYIADVKHLMSFSYIGFSSVSRILMSRQRLALGTLADFACSAWRRNIATLCCSLAKWSVMLLALWLVDASTTLQNFNKCLILVFHIVLKPS